jgi:hypothetical protein
MVAQNGQKVFGAGRFYGVPTASSPTPTDFQVAQNMSLDFKRDVKKLFGYNQLPVDVAAGMLSVTGKVELGTINSRLINDLLLGGTVSTGQTAWIYRESQTSSTATGQATVTNSAGWSLDLGVINRGTGVPLTRVASTAPGSTGTYYVSSTTAGVYQLSLTESTAILLSISYLYSTSAGQTATMSNQAMGKTGNFQAVMELNWGTEKGAIQLYNCMATDFSLATKLDDYARPGFGFEAACDATDSLGIMSFAEVN